ncbi:PH domain-containing protein [Aestuariibaculum marinum]|uniref:PH domain-containing protein n=1 Tax=Aestuariibaculum marinum TaxID=2683592 RepID=A0A8J6PUG0_9FLAO|nr:PH domain-containing protein [Aestuariibaculum marinum]MBD0823508.1 PH domain-containing protein [Aestuariibaculum marinum]
MKIYKAKRKGLINYLLFGALVLPIVIFILDKNTFAQRPILLMPLAGPLILLIWIYFDTTYKVSDGNLYYRSAFLRGKIKISSIREIAKGKTKWSGIKPALSTNGLIVKFNKYDEVYIAPESNDELVNDLLKQNSEISIV